MHNGAIKKTQKDISPRKSKGLIKRYVVCDFKHSKKREREEIIAARFGFNQKSKDTIFQ